MDTMHTIHIENQTEATLLTLARDIFNQVLKNDPNAHFLFERGPILIFRMSDKFGTDVKQLLGNIPFEIYPYPKAGSAPSAGKPNLFFEPDFIADNLDIFLPIFHANCVAAISLDPTRFHQVAPSIQLNEFQFFIERVVHTFHNSANHLVPTQDEGNLLAQLAVLKLGKPLFFIQQV